MRKSTLGGAVAVSLVAVSLVAVPGTASASRATAAAVPVVKVGISHGQASVSTAQVTPGVIEFQVTSNYVFPGKNGGPEAVAVLRTDDLPGVLAALPAVFGGDPSDPTAGAKSAAAIKLVHSLATAYGGALKGGTWQVRLPAGTYTVLGYQSAAMGKTQPTTFVVGGEPRAGALPATQGTIRAVGPVGHNKFVTSGLNNLSDGWLRFANNAHEIHFLDMTRVKDDTTNAMVRKAFVSPKEPTFFLGPNYQTEVISPGVAIALKGPFVAGKYLIDCFVPSETDGMPHALMGMWKLVNVG